MPLLAVSCVKLQGVALHALDALQAPQAMQATQATQATQAPHEPRYIPLPSPVTSASLCCRVSVVCCRAHDVTLPALFPVQVMQTNHRLVMYSGTLKHDECVSGRRTDCLDTASAHCSRHCLPNNMLFWRWDPQQPRACMPFPSVQVRSPPCSIRPTYPARRSRCSARRPARWAPSECRSAVPRHPPACAAAVYDINCQAGSPGLPAGAIALLALFAPL